jgi:hypothetical protein
MTGRDKAEQIDRAEYVCRILRALGLNPISPVFNEEVDYKKGETLLPMCVEDLRRHWEGDKYIIRRVAHVVLLDGADEASIGMTREYGLNRYCLWKPTIILWERQRGINVSHFEDDLSTYSLVEAADIIANLFGTPWKRRVWRIKMLLRSLPQWIIDQLYAWR